jgi:transposase
MYESDDALATAAQLLVEIAGPEPVHIEMSARGPKKYYQVHRAFDEKDGRLHLLGWRTKGATLRHSDDMTRALCYDADTPGDWQLLQAATRTLAASGYTSLLEVSPVGRGGHLWIIYTSLVSAAWARRRVVELAPALTDIAESWPSVELTPRNIRLPGGKYVQPGLSQWCMLNDAQGSTLAIDGRSAARVLLDYQTPAALVTPAPSESGTVRQERGICLIPTTMARTKDAQHDQGQADIHWHRTYNRFLWFKFTPWQLATLYNERHPLSELLPLEKNGMAFSPSVPERTPSTAITTDGHAWVDFSAQSLQSDGKHDGGDALELATRRNGESKAAKSATLREVARTLVREARDVLECAARVGEDPPSWVAQIMTEAGWQHYRSLCAESAAPRIASRGVTGFYNARMTTQAAHEQDTRTMELPPAPTQAGTYKGSQGQGSLEALANAIGTQISEPCGRCGCTLFYQSGPYRMCHLCYPRPEKFGRLTDEQWQRLRSLFPRKPAPMTQSDLDRR